MRSIKVLFAFLGLVFANPVITHAQQQPQNDLVTIPRSQLTKDQLAAVEQQAVQNKIDTYGKWVGLGKEVGEAVNSSLSALTAQADTLSRTNVGKFTMFIIAYKVIGSNLIRLLVAVPLMIVFTAIFIWSYRRSTMVYSVLTEVSPDRTKHYEKVNDHISSDDRWGAQLVHAIIWLFCMAILLLTATC